MKLINNTGQKFSLNKVFNILGLTILLLILAIITSAVIIIGGPKYTFMLAGGLFGLFFFVMPPQSFLSMLIVYVFLILGPLNSFAGIDTNWIPYLMGIGILFQALLYKLIEKNKNVNQSKGKIPLYLWCLLIFTSIAIFATATGIPNRYTLLTALRGWFFLWGVYFIFTSYSNFTSNFFKKLWLFFLAVGFLQLPMAIYQRLFLSSTRSHDAYWDSVIGTFPGDKVSGDSGGMAFFLIATSAMAVCIWRYGQLSGKLTLLIVIFLIAPILFGEIKISYFLIPMMTALIFRAELKRNPLKFIAGMLFAGVFIVSVFFAGIYFNSKNEDLNKTYDSERIYKSIFGYSFDKDAYDGSNNMGRFTLIKFWWDENKDEPLRLTLGYGLGSASLNNSFSISGSEGWKHRPFYIAHTNVAALLWETGIFGLFAYVAIHIFGALHAARLSKVAAIPPFHQAMLYAASIIILSKIILIPYQSITPPTQIYFLLLLGMIGFWDKQIRSQKHEHVVSL